MSFRVNEICCVWTCITHPTKKMVFIDNVTIELGRQQTVEPWNECIPEKIFEVCADIDTLSMEVYVVGDGAFLNGMPLEVHETYSLTQGDIIGFADQIDHQYEVTFTTNNDSDSDYDD